MSVKDIVKKHEEWRNRCLNLIASENVMSDEVRTLLTSDLGHRYSLRHYIDDNFYRGTKYIEELLNYGEALACKLFHVKYSDLKPISGHIAGLSTLMFLTNYGDSILTLDIESGGYPGYTKGYLPNRLGLNVDYIKCNNGELDLDGIDVNKYKAVIIAPSLVTFPPRIEKLSKLCKDNGIPFVYDVSHILGLIAGNAIKVPDDIDIMLGSTHKSFPGPQGGIILMNRYEDLSDFITLRTVDNPHYNRIAALILAMEEMSEFGKAYAEQIVKNSKTLARSLDEKGIEVLGRELDYTETHQILLKQFDNAKEFIYKLEEANIIIDNGLRLGTSEVTRRGMKENEMKHIAELIYKVYDDADISTVRKEIEGLASTFNAIHFTFTVSS
ncbi:MAG: serine hydroxymethyltransferase [Candidatus Nitrosocaldaceae archaeon]|nr:MAG: serine hydroxymethyltransferase [Candidatus Nitrosocaldaceae archaeon]